MARFEDFTLPEKRVILEAMTWSQSEFYDPGHTQEDRDTLHNMIKEVGDSVIADISSTKPAPTVDVPVPAAPEQVDVTVKAEAEKPQEPAQRDRTGAPTPPEVSEPTRPPTTPRGPAEAAAGGRLRKAPETDPTGYTGFLLIKCDHCGDVHAFCAKQPISSYRCAKCGGRTPLTDMHRLRVMCECGSKYNYLTNIITQQMDVNCFKCGCPVAVEWSERRGRYEPIEWAEARKGGHRK